MVLLRNLLVIQTLIMFFDLSLSVSIPTYSITSFPSWDPNIYAGISLWTKTPSSPTLNHKYCGLDHFIEFLCTTMFSITRTFNLPPHQMIAYEFTFYALRVVPSPPISNIPLTVSPLFSTTLIFQPLEFTQNYCSSPNPAAKRKIFGTTTHTDTTLNVQIDFPKINAYRYFRFSDFNLYFLTDQKPVISPCFIYEPSATGTLANGCSIPAQCDPSCSICYGTSSAECFQCAPGYTFNGTNCFRCDSSCSTCSGPEKNECTTCNTGFYLFNANTCLDSCQPPLIDISTATELSCGLPSFTLPYPKTGYFYWNNTFQDTCPYPLQKREVTGSGVNLCESPCESSNYLYWNSTCLSKCESSLYEPRTENGKMFCYPKCSGSLGEYMTQDGNCFSSCEPPFRTNKDNFFGPICLPPCDDSSMYFHEDSKECKPGCENFPRVDPKGYLVCSLSQPSPTPTPTPTPTIPPTESSPPLITSSVSGRGILFDTLFLAPLEPGTVTCVTLVKLMQYIRYIDIKMPKRLERMTISRGRNILSLQAGPEVTATIYSWFAKQITNNLIEKQRLHSRFLANFGGDAFVFLIFLFSALLFTVLNLISKRLGLTHSQLIFQKLETLTTWNVCIMIFGIYLDDIILFSAFEFTTLDFTRISAFISLLGCIFILLLTTSFLTVGFNIIRRTGVISTQASKAKNPDDSNKSVSEIKSYQVFFHGFSNHLRINKYFYLLYILRAACPLFLALVFFDVPIVQASFQVAFSLIFVSYILYARPLQKKINQFQLIVIEVTILTLNICVLVLAILNSQGQNNTPRYELLGDIIILGNTVLNLFTLVILAIKVLITIKEIRTLHKKNPIQAWISCIHLLVLPLQQGAFGFEELLGNINPSESIPEQKQITNKSSIVPLKYADKPATLSNKHHEQSQAVTVKNIMPQTVSIPDVNLQKTTVDLEQSEVGITERLDKSSERFLFNSHSMSKMNNIPSMNDSIEMQPHPSKFQKRIFSILNKVTSNSHQTKKNEVTANRMDGILFRTATSENEQTFPFQNLKVNPKKGDLWNLKQSL